MKKLRTLAVTFDNDLPPWQLPQFRGAVAQKVGYEHEWFHNHDAETGGFHHRYPLIQYKIESSREAMRPMLLCVETGVEEAHHLFSQPEWGLRVGQRDLPMRIHKLKVDQYNLGIFDTPFTYRVHKWQALNSDNYTIYKGLTRLADRFEFLEMALANHVLSFAHGIGWEPDRKIDIRITDLINEEWISHKQVKKLCFSVEFTCTAALPDFIGIGKGASVGFGVVRRQRKHSKTNS